MGELPFLALIKLLIECPNPPSRQLSVYAHHHRHFTSKGDIRCSKEAFLQDICGAITNASEEGNQIILLINWSSNMKEAKFKSV